VTGSNTYPSHPEVSENTSSLSTHHAPVPDLRWSCVAVHLGELELGLRACALGEGSIANHVAERLPEQKTRVSVSIAMMLRWSSLGAAKGGTKVPFRLILLKHLPLRVIADDFDVGKAAQIQSLRSELRHG